MRNEEAERTEIVQNAFETVKGVEEALLRPASKRARLVNETGFSADWDARAQGGGVVRKRSRWTRHGIRASTSRE